MPNFGIQDKRLSCIACHDPHQKVVRNDMSYDSKCLAYHNAGAKLSLGMIGAHPHATDMPLCPASQTKRISGHMPKIALPGGHQNFTDHFIRIVAKGEQYLD